MIDYTPLDVVAPYAYQKQVQQFNTTGAVFECAKRDNRRVRIIISFPPLIPVTNWLLTFDSSDASGGVMKSLSAADIELNWYSDFTLVQSQMFLTNVSAGFVVTVTSIIMTQARKERSRDAIDAIRTATQKITPTRGEQLSSTRKRKPYFNWW